MTDSAFDERAADWDTPDRIDRARRTAEAIRAGGRIPKHARAIELGAGTGLLGLELADAFDELVLADESEGMLEVARRKLRGPGDRNSHGGASAHVSVLHYRIGRDPLPAAPDEEPFDLVLSQLLLHHVQDTGLALRAMHDMLRPGGVLIAADLDAEDGSFHGPDRPDVHHQGFDRQHLRSLVDAAGFRDVEFGEAGSIERSDGIFPMFLLTATRA
jgi:SAM-dependent methyltransferase